jgi:hypothetical protein
MRSIPGLAVARAPAPFTTVQCEGSEGQIDREVSEAKLKALLKLAEAHLLTVPGFSHTARVGDATVRLVTDDAHLLHFWRANWFSGDAAAKADGCIYAVTGVEKREPGGFAVTRSLKGVLFNTNYYALLNEMARQMAAHSVRAGGGLVGESAGLEIANQGVVLLVGQDADRRLECALSLAGDERWNLLAVNRMALGTGEDGPVARSLQNACYIPGRQVLAVPALATYLDCTDAENVVGRFEDCTNEACLAEVAAGRFQCVFHAGYRGCVWSHPRCGLMIHPAWINRSYERSLSAPLIGVAVLEPRAEDAAEPAGDEAPEIEVAPAKIALSALEKGVGSGGGSLGWLCPEGEVGESEIKAFLKKLLDRVPLVTIRHGASAKIADPGELVSCFVQAGEA